MRRLESVWIAKAVMNSKTLIFMGFIASLLSVQAVDWPQYRGPNGDGTSPERGMLKEWPSTGLRPIWKTPLPDGFSSFAVSGGKAFTLIARQVDGATREVCVALNAQTGKEAWSYALGTAKYDGGADEGGPKDGPRSTPTVDSGKVYVLGGNLLLACLDANTGKEIWTKDIVKEHSGKVIHWQNAASPLVDGDMLFVAGGGPDESLLGLEKETGKVIWKGQTETITHATPVAGTILGERQIIFFMHSGLVSVAPKTGDVLWRHT